MTVQRYKYFSPRDAARLSSLQLVARQVVEGVISGMHRSPHRGFSVEFSEHREYVPGDEIRHLDWRAYARSDRYYIKLYEQETNLRATLVLDSSNSMRFAGKFDYARHLAACLAYLLAQQQDLAGLASVDTALGVELPPGGSPAHLDRLFKELELLDASGTTGLGSALHELAEKLPSRSLVVLISDLWLEADELARALQHLRYRRHQVLLIHLIDDAEISLAYDRQVTLEDLETGQKIQIDPADIRATYVGMVADHLAALRAACNRCDAEYHAVNLSTPYDKALIQLLDRRA